MKKLSILTEKISMMKGITAVAFIAAAFYITAFTSLAAEGTVTAETVNIRKETSTDSEVVGSTVKGKKIDILEAVKDSSGTVWYKVAVSGGGYGYIRSDCVSTTETITISENTSSTASDAGNTTKPADTVPTSIGEQQAVISAQTNVRVRSGASTQHDTLTSLPNGTPITLIGEANDNQGKKWYQITCDYNGRKIEGYVLASLTAPSSGESASEGSGDGSQEGGLEGENPEGAEGGDNPEQAPAEGVEGTPEDGAGEAPEQAPVEEHKDYEIVYESGEYYFNNYIAGTQQSVSNLLAVAESNEKLQGQVRNGKIIIIILAAVIVLLFIVITVLIFKIRDLSYEYDEEEEDEEEEPAPVKKRVRRRMEDEDEEPVVRKRVKKQIEEEESAPVRKKRPAARTEEHPVKSGKSRVREDKELYAAEKREPAKKPVARRSQNFLVDDDEFEFEFLNMDDKDL